MANEKNLKPQSTRTKSEQREIARKGGKASGAARRAKKEMREWAKIALDELIKDKQGNELATRYAMVKKQILKAINNSDTKAFEKVLRVAGEWEQENAMTTPVVVVVNTSDKGARAMERLKETD